MARKVFLYSLLIILSISLGLFTLKGFGKEQQFEKNDDIKIISEKIDEILNNQQDIIERLKDIREQQDIIRIRASRR